MGTQIAKPATPAPRAAVKVKAGLPEFTKDQVRHPYWIGTTRDCPIQNVTVGGVTFPLFSGTPVFGIDGEPDRHLDMGATVELTNEQVEAIKVAVALRVLRLVGEPDKHGRRRGTLLLVDGGSRRYSPQEGDVPLARFLYMHRADQISAEVRSQFPPETMLEE